LHAPKGNKPGLVNPEPNQRSAKHELICMNPEPNQKKCEACNQPVNRSFQLQTEIQTKRTTKRVCLGYFPEHLR